MVPHRSRRTARVAATALALASLAGLATQASCTKAPLVAPSGTVITLLATTTTLPVNGSTDIIAILIENGTQTTSTGGTPPPPATTTTTSTGTTVHNGTQVSFTTTLGTITPAQAETNQGQATVKLVADGRSGVATVTAYSGGATKTMTINVGSASAARIVVAASPQTLPATGGTTTVTATVQDQQGNPISGVPVTFSTTGGSLAVTTVVTDVYGNATTTLTTTVESTVTATAGGGTTAAPTPGTVVIKILPNSTVTLTGPTGTVTVSAPTTFTVGVPSTVIVTDVMIDYGDGEKFDLGAISASQTVSHTYGSVGAFNVTATATFADGTAKVVHTAVVVNDYTVGASCGNNVLFGAQSTFTGTVTPAGVMSISDYVWNFGEEGVQHGLTTTHVFQSRGTKVVSFTVYPTKGPAHSASCSLEVQ